MPVLSANTGTLYPTVNGVMNVARAWVNDMANDADGDILTNDAPASQTYLSAAWRWYQDRCMDAGVEMPIREVTVYGVPAQASNDITAQAWISADGCSDGSNDFETPALPQDLIQPLSVWRRTVNGQFGIMRLASDGLPRYLDYGVFDWRDNGMYFYAGTQASDFLIRYSAYQDDLLIAEPNSFVRMRGCQDCLGARIAFQYALARGAAQAPAMQALADGEFEKGAMQRTSKRKQRLTVRRQGYSAGRCGSGWPMIHN